MDEKTCGIQHQQLLEWVKKISEAIGSHEAHIQTSIRNQEEIFDRLRDLQSTLDRRSALPDDIKLLQTTAYENRANIAKLQTTVSNGLTERTKNIETTVHALKESLERLLTAKKIDDATAKSGLQGYFSQAWKDFRKWSGPILITVIVCVLVLGFARIVIFQEYPFPINGYIGKAVQHGTQK